MRWSAPDIHISKDYVKTDSPVEAGIILWSMDIRTRYGYQTCLYIRTLGIRLLGESSIAISE